MSKHDFSEQEFAARRQRTREAIGAAGCDWFVAFHPTSIHWLTGSDAKSYQEFQCLLLSAQPGPVVVLTREGERNEFAADAWVDDLYSWGGGIVEDPLEHFARLIQTYRLDQARVGMEVPAYYLHPQHYVGLRRLLGEALVVEANDLIHDLKMVKSPRELEYIRRASQLADAALETFRSALGAGRSELELAGEVYHALLRSGSGLAASPINLVSGERSGFSHGAPTNRVLRPGDFGSIEYGATWRRYTATVGRNFCLGTPTPRMRELDAVVQAASAACVREIRAGVPATVPHAAAREVIVAAGLEQGRVHTTGYGLAPGFPPTWGEPLHMLDGSRYLLQAGMVVSVEPPVFLGDERLGARVIDNYLVTSAGAERLSHFPPDLIVIP